MSAALVSQERVASPGVASIAFAVHLVAWSGFVALKVAAESFMPGEGWLTAAALLLLAWAAGGAAILIGRGLHGAARTVFAIGGLLVFGLAGIAEVAFRFLPLPYDSPLWLLGAPFAYLGIWVFPFLLAPVSALVVSRPASASTVPRSRGYVMPAGAVLLSVLIIVAGGVVFAFGAFVPWMSWMLAGCAAAGSYAALLLLRWVSTAAGPGAVLSGARASTMVVLVCGAHVCFLSVAQAVYSDWSGIFGALVWAVAIFGYVMGGVALCVSLGIALRDTDRDHDSGADDLSALTDPL